MINFTDTIWSLDQRLPEYYFRNCADLTFRDAARSFIYFMLFHSKGAAVV